MDKTLKSLTPFQYNLLLIIILYSIMISSLPAMSAFYILGDLGGGTDTASYGVTFFVLGNFVTKPFAVVIGKYIGRIKLLWICFWSLFAVTLAIIFVQSYYAYLVLRFFQGFASGPIFLLGVNLIGLLATEEKTESFIKICLIFLLIGSIISASVGAIFAYNNAWRFSFGLSQLFLLILMWLTKRHFNNQDSSLEKIPIDYVGLITFVIGITALGFCLITGQVIDGFRSKAFITVFTVGCITFVFFILWNIWNKTPILQFRLLKNFYFILTLLHTFCMYMFYYAIIILLSYWLHLYVNYSINWIAVSLLFGTVGPLFLIFAYKVRNKQQYSWEIALAYLLLTAISFFISKFSAEVNFGRIIIAKLGSGIALAFFLPQVFDQVRTTYGKEDVPYAFSFFTMSRLLGTFVGTAYFTTLWERRFVFYYQRLGGDITPFSAQVKRVWFGLNRFHTSDWFKVRGLNEALVRQSRALALDDCYYLIGLLMLALFLFTLVAAWMRRRSKLRENKELLPHSKMS